MKGDIINMSYKVKEVIALCLVEGDNVLLREKTLTTNNLFHVDTIAGSNAVTLQNNVFERFKVVYSEYIEDDGDGQVKIELTLMNDSIKFKEQYNTSDAFLVLDIPKDDTKFTPIGKDVVELEYERQDLETDIKDVPTFNDLHKVDIVNLPFHGEPPTAEPIGPYSGEKPEVVNLPFHGTPPSNPTKIIVDEQTGDYTEICLFTNEVVKTGNIFKK